ncbi:MAG TPA: hypothetical protein VD948_05560 [Rhodothermales bacterium]|nr:hypothetical protein [Rhodothermales bacterium]
MALLLPLVPAQAQSSTRPPTVLDDRPHTRALYSMPDFAIRRTWRAEGRNFSTATPGVYAFDAQGRPVLVKELRDVDERIGEVLAALLPDAAPLEGGFTLAEHLMHTETPDQRRPLATDMGPADLTVVVYWSPRLERSLGIVQALEAFARQQTTRRVHLLKVENDMDRILERNPELRSRMRTQTSQQ